MSNEQYKALLRLVIYGIIFAVAWVKLHPTAFDVAQRNAAINACQDFYGNHLATCPTPGPGETP